MYSDGWIASCRHGRLPWETSGSSSFDDDVWELHNIEDDFSQSINLANKEPERLRRLQDLFMADAAKYNVLPLDDRFSERLDVTLRPSFFAGREKVTFYPGMVRLPEGSGPKLVGVPFTFTAPVEIPKGGVEGVIFALGGDAAGWSLFLWEGKARFHYNFFGLRRYDVTDPQPLKAGKHTIELNFTPANAKPGVAGSRRALGRWQESRGRAHRRTDTDALRHRDHGCRHGLRVAGVLRLCEERPVPLLRKNPGRAESGQENVTEK